MNKSSLGAFGIPEYMPPDGGGTFIVNLPAPTSERTTMNERNPGAFGISELMPPNGGETFIVIYLQKCVLFCKHTCILAF